MRREGQRDGGSGGGMHGEAARASRRLPDMSRGARGQVSYTMDDGRQDNDCPVRKSLTRSEVDASPGALARNLVPRDVCAQETHRPVHQAIVPRPAVL